MRFNYFSELLKNAKMIVGNSSAGVREAPFLGLPSLNIGTRQSERSSSSSIFHCDAFDPTTIATILNQEWGKRYPSDTSFGDGRAVQRFIEVLGEEAFWEMPLQKYFNDVDMPSSSTEQTQ